MLRPPNVHLCHGAIRILRVEELPRFRSINLTRWRAGVRLLIVRKRGPPGYKCGSIVKKQGAVAFALRVHRAGIDKLSVHRIEKLCCVSGCAAMATSGAQNIPIWEQSGGKQGAACI